MEYELSERPHVQFTGDPSELSVGARAVERRPQILSFFCGAGGLDLGFSQAGFDLIFAADYFSAAVETHNANTHQGLAREVDLSELSAEDIRNLVERVAPGAAPVGVIGGPPCQGFSRANTQRCHTDPRNDLAKHYARSIVGLADIYPLDFFVFENVPELLAAENESILRSLKRTLTQKFHVFVKCLDAADFGVPQNRKRVFIVGTRKTGGKKVHFRFPEPTAKSAVTVRDTIYDLPEPVFFSRSLTPESIPFHPNHWTMQPRSPRFGPELVTSGRSLIRLDWDKPSRTVAYGNREIHVHPSGVRRLSIYEAMLLQGFPAWYRLSGNLSEQVTQVSNAVPPPVARAIGTALLEHFSTNRQAELLNQ
ncbi:DNA cytosine methyltransferase [Paraburkholderia caribensis]|uniref:DNA cytosine methyltransferase n=1 Tax=Paraburkholderia caribensis TaxID=75105 RepID=UPI001CAC62DD|nr:DNA cytosine methyltransferase [Paraburkholderia caribensis]CAG9262097.1 DNA (cytosine-5-)-methyltransferase [Paraburkholderia caribensis]